MKWKWILWQVIAPIIGPIVISAIVVGFWWTGTNFPINWHIVVDITPWALIFYCITLIGATMNDFWAELGTRRALGASLIGAGLALYLYAAFIVIWRHDPKFIPGISVYGVTLGLLLISVVLCHRAAKD